MIQLRFLIALLLASVCTYGQITIIGHNRLNNEPIRNTLITVKENGVATRTLDTKASSDFLIQLDYGKSYQLFFTNAKSPRMYMEVNASNVPEDKRIYKMVHELNVPFFDREDDDIDTTVLKDPFQRIVFDGNSKMVDDSLYNKNFRSRVIKPHERGLRSLPMAVTLAGKVFLNSDPKLTINNKSIVLIGKKGQTIRTTYTNRFGAFAFTGINAGEVAKIKMELAEPAAKTHEFTLVNSKNYTVSIEPADNSGSCTWELNPEDVDDLTDNHYTTNIGGKLVASSPKSKKFFANKTVYLSNKFNTVIKKTTTNILGTFVFEDIKPDNIYFIGVDKYELANGEKADLLNKDDKYVATLDTLMGGKASFKVNSGYNKKFNDISISNDEMTMSVKATIYGDNVNNPIGRLKVLLLNDVYQVIDSATTNDLGAFKFKYLPFLKRFYLSAENSDNLLDVYNNILIYNKDSSLVKIMTHEKGSKFSYRPLNAELFTLRDVELEDPWLEFMGNKKPALVPVKKIIIENVLFDQNKYSIKPEAKEVLDKVVLVLQSNKTLKVEIGAHTDSRGSDEDNLKLSEQRAKAVVEYVTKAGVDAKRVIYKGYGETKLLNDCGNDKPCSELEHARNRRIEFIIFEESNTK